MLAVRVGVVADGMFLQRGNHVCAMAALKRARFFANDLKCRLNALLGQERRQAFGRVIALRQDVVLGVEPENDIDLARRWPVGKKIGIHQQEDRYRAKDASKR